MDTNLQDLFDAVEVQAAHPKKRKGYTNGLHLSADSVCAILDSCLKNSVTKFSFGGLEVEFAAKPQSLECEAVGAGSPIPLEDQERQGRREHLTSLADVVDDELEMLKITDPLQYEKLMAEQEAK